MPGVQARERLLAQEKAIEADESQTPEEIKRRYAHRTETRKRSLERAGAPVMGRRAEEGEL